MDSPSFPVYNAGAARLEDRPINASGSYDLSEVDFDNIDTNIPAEQDLDEM
jgi:hypothetical protein